MIGRAKLLFLSAVSHPEKEYNKKAGLTKPAFLL
jgi:hypothetical protein